ncbi:hypothetical protein H6G89_09915 [Oscillatoria sp. FACHB-1407]|uniref:hypothetical protein n=1 Tax=Oscillatoria sp. FACHB-1407 TaxID=2692847 RepID=UPI001681C415|nr:hypothetical protein [Oscillatoria sp. FACHB-1407]MBD2461362.1 hypothetical protein [Oscillatoria sp. FACHB-1407]
MRNPVRSPLIRLSVLSLATVALFAPLPAAAQTSNRTSTRVRTSDYQACASSLTGAGISEADAADACAAALYPQDVARCVTRIDNGTEIAATDALSGCRQVRRPIELATCVNDIDNVTTGAESLVVLDNCRRSLLPTRFSACVVGLSREIEFAPAEALETCIAAGDRPSNLRPSFIPVGQEPVTLPIDATVPPAPTPVVPPAQ